MESVATPGDFDTNRGGGVGFGRNGMADGDGGRRFQPTRA